MCTVAIGSDPNAGEYKKALIEHLREMGHEVTDFGSDDTVYANVAIAVAEAVTGGRYERGILVCGTGIGMSIAANKVRGAYAALITDCYSAARSRRSNDANIACIGAFTLGIRHAMELVDIFLCSEYDPAGSSEPKVSRIKEYERTCKGN